MYFSKLEFMLSKAYIKKLYLIILSILNFIKIIHTFSII